MFNIIITVENAKDGVLQIKLDNVQLDGEQVIDPVFEANEIKELVEGREKVVKNSNLRVYFDKELVTEIRYRLAKLLAYYALERAQT